jgi:putative membrane protein
MLRLLLVAPALLSLIIALPAPAQTGNPAFAPSGTPAAKPGVPAPDQLDASDRIVIHQLAIGNAAEIELGKLAQQKAHNQPVKSFADTMIRDHDAAGKRLADLAQAAQLPLPSGFDDEHQALREHLGKLTGAAFDVAYIQAQAQDHQKTLQLLEYEIGSGQDQALREFAANTLPKIREHLQMAQAIALTVTPQAPQEARAPASPAAPPATPPGVGPSAAPQTPPVPQPSGSR